jgi:TPR repeat protein
MYQNGEGVPQDYGLAAKWFYQAAVQGYAAAQFNLAGLYMTGRGVPYDDVEAVIWYRRAADQGVAAAKDILGHF